jgi:hypothetical protein
MSRPSARLPASLRLLWLALALLVLVLQPALSMAAQAHETLHWLQGSGLSDPAHHPHGGHGATHGHAATPALSVAGPSEIQPADVHDTAPELAAEAVPGAESESAFSRLLHASPCCVHSATVPSIELLPLSLAPVAQPLAEGARLRADTALPRALRPPITG